MAELKRCPFCGGEASIYHGDSTDGYIKGTDYVLAFCGWCGASIREKREVDVIRKWNTRPNPWHTGTPTEKGLYVVLTKVSMDGVSSSEGTYIFDYWDGCSFQYLKRKALVFSLIEPDIYSWVKWQKIEEKEDGREETETNRH